MTALIPDGQSAAALETAAREKALLDFLSHVRMSLMVWQIDSDVREHCEPVITWLRRITAELSALGKSP